MVRVSSQKSLGDVVDELQERVGELEQRDQAQSRRGDSLREDIWNLEEEVEELRDRVAELEAQIEPNPKAREYNEMDRDTKVQKVRLALVRRASDRLTGKAAMDYGDVQALFDNHPSAGHTYDLMGLAAEMDGFEYDTTSGSTNRIRVDLDAVKDEAMLHAANKEQDSGGS